MIQKPETLGEVMIVATRGLNMDDGTSYSIAAHVLERDRAWVLAHPEEKLETEQIRQICNMLTWVRMGRPLAQLTGQRAFYGLDFIVTKDVLVPRPETEHLIELALERLPHDTDCHIVDVGTGSGIIAVTLAVHRPRLRVTAVDVSPAALAVARQNAVKHQVVERVTFAESDLLAAVEGQFDMIAANLPYIETEVLRDLPVRKWEPRLALDGGPEGLDLFRRLLAQAPHHLTSPGSILLEIGYQQGGGVTQLCEAAFPLAAVKIHRDLARLDRVISIDQTAKPT